MSAYYSQRPRSIEPETTCSGVECALAGALDHLLVLVWIGVLGLFVLALLYLPKARERCDEERRQTRAERDAFDQFVRRLADIDAAVPTGTSGARAAIGPPTSTIVRQADDRSVRAVRNAYRETVMAVPHYEEDYGESLAANVSEEFDPGAATVLTDGGGLTPEIKRGLAQSAIESRNGRESLLDVLDREASSLERANETFSDCEATFERIENQPLQERSYGGLLATWRQLRRCSDRIESVLEERQAEIQSGANLSRQFDDTWATYAYLYGPLPVSHPILAEGARLLDEKESLEADLVRALSGRA